MAGFRDFFYYSRRVKHRQENREIRNKKNAPDTEATATTACSLERGAKNGGVRKDCG
jgi:hypothetical protein